VNGLSFEYPTVVKICGSNVRNIIKRTSGGIFLQISFSSINL
jgi:hypothetical protein